MPESRRDYVRLDDDVAFAVTADAGELEKQAESLVRSISATCPRADVVVFIPERSRSRISEAALELFDAEGTVVYGEIPVPDYPISALLGAFVEAEQVTDVEYLVALDTDTLLLRPIEVEVGADVWLRPADVGAQYWCSADARADWEALYERFDLAPPGRNEFLRASVDRRRIPPYWNSGVVVTTDRNLPARWLRYTEELSDDEARAVSIDEFFLDQISLALAVRENEVAVLDERANYPLGGRLLVPDDVSVLHYGDRRNLTRVLPPRARRGVARFGAVPPVSGSGLARSLLDVASTRSGRVFGYRTKRRVRWLLRRVLPEPVVDA